MKIKNYILTALKQEGISYLFMVPGGLIDPFMSAFEEEKGITPIVAAHEGGAAFMADGYGRALHKFGACLCIGGPGVTNTTTALLSAKSDGTAILALSGEVSSTREGLGSFQDASVAGLDDMHLLKLATRFSINIESKELFTHHFEQALKKMLYPSKGPVHICLPKDLQDEAVCSLPPPLDHSFYETRMLDAISFEKSLNDFSASKIVFLVGAGIDPMRGAELLVKVSEKFHIPIATTLRAKGIFPEDHPLSLGVFGYAGTAHATEAFLSTDAEVIVVLGSGLNQRDSMNWNSKLKAQKRFIYVNLDLSECPKDIQNLSLIPGDSGAFLEALLSQEIAVPSDRKKWIDHIKKKPRYYDMENLINPSIPIHPARVVTELRKAAPRDTVLIVDSGAHRAFFGHYWTAYGPLQYLTAANLGPMGWAIGGGIGAKLARPEKPCCVVTGDGCMLMHGIEIQTAARYNIPIVFVVINNQALGNVFLRAQKEGKIACDLTTTPSHDFAAFARSFGMEAVSVKDPSQLEESFKQAFEAKKPYLIDVKCDKTCSTPIEPFMQKNFNVSYHD